jgi:hypothetical protein
VADLGSVHAEEADAKLRAVGRDGGEGVAVGDTLDGGYEGAGRGGEGGDGEGDGERGEQ